MLLCITHKCTPWLPQCACKHFVHCNSCVLQRISGEVGAQLQLVRADQQQAERHEQEERQMRQDAIHDAAGKAVLCCALLWCGVLC